MGGSSQPLEGPSAYRFGPFEVNIQEGELRKHGIRLKLQEKSCQILVSLLERPGELVTREQLRARLWASNTYVDFEHGLDAAMNKLRATLGDTAECPRYVETVRGKGYRLLGTVEVRNGRPSEKVMPGAEAPGAYTLVRPYASRLRPWILGAACVALVGVTLVWAGRERWNAQAIRSARRPAITSLAVLPLQNLSNDPAQEYFADGMTDALITELARIRSLRVISRASVMEYKGARKPLPQIARELDVDAIVEGTVTRSGDRVRITAQLLEAATDRHLWAEKYERSLGDVLALQDEVAEAIGREVQAGLNTQQVAARGQRHVDPEAYELYAKGRFLWNRASPGDREKAEKFFQEALKKQPDWAPAYAGLADVYSVVYDPRAFEAAKKALELDETLAEAHNSLAMSLELRWDYAGAEKEFRRAIELNPNYSTAHQMYAFLLSATGRHEEALTEATRAQQLDPISLYVSESLGDVLFFARRYDAAMERYRKTLEMDPHFPMAHRDLGDVYLQKRMYREAIAEFEIARAASTPGRDLLASLGQAYALAGKRAKAQQVLVQLSEQTKRNPDAWYFAAPVYVALGEKERALNCLEKAYAGHASALASLKMDPRLDGLRSEARFQDLVRRVGLPTS